MGTAVVAATILGIVFGSYLTAPVAVVLALLGMRRTGSARVRIAAGLLCSVIAVDKILPQPNEFPASTRIVLPLFRQVLILNCQIVGHWN